MTDTEKFDRLATLYNITYKTGRDMAPIINEMATLVGITLPNLEKA